MPRDGKVLNKIKQQFRQKNRPVPGKTISKKVGIPRQALYECLDRLKKQNKIEYVSGRYCGYKPIEFEAAEIGSADNAIDEARIPTKQEVCRELKEFQQVYERPASGDSLAKEINCSRQKMYEVIEQLKKEDIVEYISGPDGGYKLVGKVPEPKNNKNQGKQNTEIYEKSDSSESTGTEIYQTGQTESVNDDAVSSPAYCPFCGDKIPVQISPDYCPSCGEQLSY